MSNDIHKDDLRKLIERIESVVPYVTATLSTGNTFPIDKMSGTFHGDAKDWIAVHTGRTMSSRSQLDYLLQLARELKTTLSSTP